MHEGAVKSTAEGHKKTFESRAGVAVESGVRKEAGDGVLNSTVVHVSPVS